jgi:hypothetical protein
MNSRTFGLIVLVCLAVVGAQVAGGLLYLGGALVHEVAIQPADDKAPIVMMERGGVINQFVEEVAVGGGAPRAQACTREELQAARGDVPAASDCTVSGPYTHNNLSVFLVHGPDTMQGQRLMTLQAALGHNLALVHAGAIAVDNRADVPVFIQAGDIIKGGTQDRVLPYDYLVPVGRSRMPLNVFCVEAGRCAPRPGELSASFESSTEQLPTRQLQLAARYRHSQQAVWNAVSQLQEALERNVGGSVQAQLSPTSLQLTLETRSVQHAVASYVNAVGPQTAGKDDTIGVVCAINGQIQHADIYASSSLFRDLWPKLLKADAVAALAARTGSKVSDAPGVEAVEKFLARSDKGQQCRRVQHDGTVVLQQESDRAILFDTCDPTRQNVVIHRSILVK